MRRAAALLLAGLLLLLLADVAAAQPQPAFPRLAGRVVDEAGVLDPAAEAGLSRDLEAHERATQGQQVVVATLRSLQGLTVEEFANRLFREWRLGGAERDDGALLVVAPQERKVRIEVGYGLEGVLTDAASATIVQSLILPRFRAGDLQGGIVAGARGVLELLRPEDGAVAAQGPGWTAPRQAPQAAAALPVVPILFAFVFFILLTRVLGRRGGGPDGRRTPRRRGFGHGYPPLIVFPGGFGGGRGGGGFGGGGGGGFSGGGGSSGGGGASGSW